MPMPFDVKYGQRLIAGGVIINLQHQRRTALCGCRLLILRMHCCIVLCVCHMQCSTGVVTSINSLMTLITNNIHILVGFSLYINSGAVATHRSSFDDDELVAYWLDDVMCTGTENSLVQCVHNGLGFHNCQSNERAGVICQGTWVFLV